jgi:hypothetical protein
MDLRILTCEKFLELLGEFYEELPERPDLEYAPLSPERLPEPARSLLVHDRDMTSTLERHYAEPVALRILSSKIRRNWYSRHIVLETAHSKRPAEYGAIRILLPLLSERARSEVLEEHQPLGGILNAHRLTYRSCPGAFFKVFANPLICDSLRMDGPDWLFGRCNCLSDDVGRTLAEVIEILPPANGERGKETT